MSETPAVIVRRAAARMREQAGTALPWWMSVARWLESLEGIEWKEHGPATEELTHALVIARAYLNGGES